MFVIDKRVNESNRDYAVRVIRENIIMLELAPGALVSEKEIADELGISRTPIREAIIELSKVGIIEVLPQIGSRISLIDYDVIEESRFMRFMLEKGIVEILCFKGLTKEQSFLLEENVQLQELFSHDEKPTQRFFSLDEEFHELLFRYANKELAYKMCKQFNIHFDRVRHITTTSPITVKELALEHRRLFQYILDRAVHQAVALMTIHLSRYEVDSKSIQEKYHDYIIK